MKDGSIHSGFVTSQQDGVIELRNTSGTTSTIQDSEVASKSISTVSAMPPGLHMSMSVKEFASLLDFLQSLH